MSENELRSRCLAGDETAWEEFYSTYYYSVKQIVSWRKWNFTEHVIEEIVQDVFLDLIKGLKSFKGDSTLLTYVQKITKNKCVSELRREITLKRRGDKESVSYEDVAYKTTSDLDEPISTGPFGRPEDTFLKTEEARLMRTCIEQLSDNCKDIVNLRYYDDLSYEEISKKLGLPDGTVCSRLKRCLITLTKIYTDMISGKNN